MNSVLICLTRKAFSAKTLSFVNVTAVNSMSIPRSTTLSTPFEYNTVQEILTNKQLSLSVTLKTAEISVMLP